MNVSRFLSACLCSIPLQERFHQLDLRLAHLIHHDTAALLQLAAQATAAGGEEPGSAAAASQLLPDALLWHQHQQQFQTVRNEGETRCLHLV